MANRLVVMETIGAERARMERWTREPTAEDIRAYLQARPDVAVEVVDGLWVAGPWQQGSGAQSDAGRYYGDACVVRVEYRPRQNDWVVCSGVMPLPRMSFASRADAMAAADATLVAAGWARAGGGPGGV